MKHYICIMVIALVHRATCFPVGEPMAGVSPSVPSLTPEMKGAEQKSDPAILPSGGVLPDKVDIMPPAAAPQKEIAAAAAPTAVVGDVAVSPSPAPTATAAASPVVHDHAPKPVVVADEPSSAHKESVVTPHTDAVKSEIAPSTAAEEIRVPAAIIVEQVAVSSEQPKEANSQVNTVSVDEPKPVRNEVKSEIPKEEKTIVDEQKVKEEVKVADAVIKDEVKSVVADQVKSEKVADEVTKSAEKVDAAKNVMVGEVKRDEVATPVSSEENVRKGDESVSDEKMVASPERVVVSDEKKESAEKNNAAASSEEINKHEKKDTSSAEKTESSEGKRDSSSEEAKEDTKPAEKPIEEPKKDEKKEEMKKEEKKETVVIKDEKKELREESSVKPIVEAQPSPVVEPAKPSTVAAAPVAGPPASMDSTVTEKVDVIKREAAKDNKQDEKKPTEIVKKDKSQIKVGSSVQKDDEIKSSKGQDKIVN